MQTQIHQIPRSTLYIPYRVIAVTNCQLPEIEPPFNTTSYTYCGPHSKLWLSQDGIESPDSSLVMLEYQDTLDGVSVEFEYDNGRYVGYHTRFAWHHHDALAHIKKYLEHLLHIKNISVVHNISSL